jgi:hypothetical protein
MRVAWLLGLLLVAGCDDSAPSRRPPAYPPMYGPPPQQPGAPPEGPPTGPALSADQIRATVNAAYPSFTQCYMRSESFMTGRSGSVTMYFEAARAGNVTLATDRLPSGVAPAAGPLGDAALDQCLAGVFMGLRFPAAGDSTQASWTFNFSP